MVPGDRNRYPPGYDRDRYGPMMPGDRDRYGPMMPGDRDRYGPMMPGGYLPHDRYPMMPEIGDKYGSPGGYDSKLTYTILTESTTFFNLGNRDRFPMMPGGDRYPMRPSEPYPHPMRPYDRYPTSPARPPTQTNTDSIDSKYPPTSNVNSNRYPSDDRYGGPKDRYNPDDRGTNIPMYPDTRHPPSRGQQPVDRPYGSIDPMYSVRYPENMPLPSSMMGPYGHYPVSENRFPVGNDRFPVNIYKYGNRPMYMMPGMMGTHPYDMDNRGYPHPSMMRPGGRPPYVMVGFGDFDSGVSDMYGSPYGSGRPPIMSGTRCDEQDSYKQMGLRQKMRNQFVRKKLRAQNLIHCQRECSNARDFVCRSFNYRDDGERPPQQGVESFNCELSDRDTRELNLDNPQMFETSNYDFYERSIGGRSNDGECLDVSQVCNEDGMEFTLRTSEPFTGRIYSYGFYDR